MNAVCRDPCTVCAEGAEVVVLKPGRTYSYQCAPEGSSVWEACHRSALCTRARTQCRVFASLYMLIDGARLQKVIGNQFGPCAVVEGRTALVLNLFVQTRLMVDSNYNCGVFWMRSETGGCELCLLRASGCYYCVLCSVSLELCMRVTSVVL